MSVFLSQYQTKGATYGCAYGEHHRLKKGCILTCEHAQVPTSSSHSYLRSAPGRVSILYYGIKSSKIQHCRMAAAESPLVASSVTRAQTLIQRTPRDFPSMLRKAVA